MTEACSQNKLAKKRNKTKQQQTKQKIKKQANKQTNKPLVTLPRKVQGLSVSIGFWK